VGGGRNKEKERERESKTILINYGIIIRNTFFLFINIKEVMRYEFLEINLKVFYYKNVIR
jgi:hypothetical protein